MPIRSAARAGTACGRQFAVALVALVATSGSIYAQVDTSAVAVPRVEDFTYDGRVSEWRARRVDHVLEATEGRPQALIWIGQVDDGLVVAAEIRGAATPSESDVLSVLLAGSEDPQFPAIGWGHQFGFEVLADSTACSESASDFEGDPCVAWFAEQRAHRDRIRPLFQRRWQLQLDNASRDSGALRVPPEIRATPAFAGLPGADRMAALSPRGQPGVLVRPILGTGNGLGLEMLIPWSAFPPVRAPDLEAVRIAVEWAPVDATTDDVADLGGAVLRPLTLPLRHTTPCAAGLAGVLIQRAGSAPRRASADAVLYMIPEPSAHLRNLIIMDNHASGYQYAPDPETLSPQAFEASFQVRDVGAGRRLCAPILALEDEAGRLSPEDWTHTGDDEQPTGFVDLETVEVRELPDGNLLVLSGPRAWASYYGSGQCGACPRVGVEVFHVNTTTGEIHPALRYLNLAEPGVRDVEIEVSADWTEVRTYTSAVTDFEADPIVARWSSERYCLIENETPTYEKCGEAADVPEPPPFLRPGYRSPP